MLDSERTFKIKARLPWTVFENFAYVSSYLHLKSFAWKRDCPISSKLQTSRIGQRSFKKALIEFYKLHPNRKHKNNPSTF